MLALHVEHDVVAARCGSARLSCRALPHAMAALRRLDVVQQHRELVAAERASRCGVCSVLQRLAERAHHRLQQLVAGGVPERVVDLLEVVEVDQRQGEARRTGRRVANRSVQGGVERAPVGRSRQLVGQGLLPDGGELTQLQERQREAGPRTRANASRARTVGTGSLAQVGAAARDHAPSPTAGDAGDHEQRAGRPAGSEARCAGAAGWRRWPPSPRPGPTGVEPGADDVRRRRSW